MARCKYGKLKNPVGGRRCKRRKAGAKRRRGGARRARRSKVRVPFILAGLAALGLLAYTQSQEA